MLRTLLPRKLILCFRPAPRRHKPDEKHLNDTRRRLALMAGRWDASLEASLRKNIRRV